MTLSPHIFIATPCYGGNLTIAYTQSVLALQAAAASRGVRTTFHLLGNESLIVRARNELACAFLKTDATHLMFIDADIGFEAQAVFRLLDFDQDMSAVAYPLKRIDWERVRRAVAMNRSNLASSSLEFVVTWDGDRLNVRGDGFAKVRYAGTGFLLIKRAVLERIAAAHPELKYKAIWRTTDIARGDAEDRVSFFECMIDRTTGEYLSEDYAFCRRWLDLGGEIWLDVKSELTHFGTHAFRGSFADQLLREPGGG